ncbi:MAG: hypothetical protein WAL68_08340 [Candidatus Binatus sp.]
MYMTTRDQSADEAVQFTWTCYESGYEWRKAQDDYARVPPPFSRGNPVADTGWVLTTGRPPHTCEERVYPPPANLFLRFSETEPAKEGIKAFADHYGLLGLEEGEGYIRFPIPNEPGKGGSDSKSRGENVKSFMGYGESLAAWKDRMREMRIAVDLWTMLHEAQNGSDWVLRRYVQWKGSDRVVYETPEDAPENYRVKAIIASPQVRPEILRRFSPGSVVGPAQHYLQRLINYSLQATVSPKLLWSWSRRRGADPVAAPRTLGLYFVPESLLGYMWLQLAEAVAARKRFRRCKACRAWMLLATSNEGSRTSRLTCSNTCRMRLYQERMKKATQLFAKGKTVDQIARRMDAEPSHVRRRVRTQPKSKESGRSAGQ